MRGRKPALTPEQAEEVWEMYRGVWKIIAIARYFRVSEATILHVLDRKGPYKNTGQRSTVEATGT